MVSAAPAEAVTYNNIMVPVLGGHQDHAAVVAACKVAPDRGAQVLEMALLAHGGRIPAGPAESFRQRGEAKAAVHTTASVPSRRPGARTGATPTCRKFGCSMFARCVGDWSQAVTTWRADTRP